MNELESQVLQLHIKHSKEIYSILDAFRATGEAGLLFYLFYNQKKYSAGELVEALGLTSGRVANILKMLEKKEFIVRERDEEDKRKVMVALTDKGKIYIEEIYKDSVRKHKLILQELGEEDARELIRIAEKIFKILKADII